MAQVEMEQWCPRHRLLGPARLPGFRFELLRRSVRWGGGAADIVEAPGEEVWGVLYEVDERDLDGLDAKERLGVGYRRREVQVELDGRLLEAYAYEVIDKMPEPLPPRPAYRERLLTGARERGLPRDWLSELEQRLG